jgi:glutamate--cysteine ligase
MGDIGYQNRREQGAGIKACYDSLGAYVNSLTHAIETPAPLWKKIGVKVDGEYRQLNANILQIENEYYSSIRPKQILDGLEKPVMALRDRGIRYIELRSLDVNAYHPLGVDDDQIRVIETLLLYCLLADSPSIGMQERWEIDRNLEKIAHRGRDPEFRLMRNGRGVSLRDWGGEVVEGLLSVCDALDSGQLGAPYRAAVLAQREKINDPDATPSATMLRDMREHGEGFYGFARRMSAKHFHYFRERALSAEHMSNFDAEAAASWRRQAEIEASDIRDFDTFLAEYHAQH